MLEMLLGHEVFTNLWCLPYDHLHDDEAFPRRRRRDRAPGQARLDAVRAVCRRRCACSWRALDLEPARRATVNEPCEAAYFDLVLPNAEGGVSEELRLTYDSTRRSFL